MLYLNRWLADQGWLQWRPNNAGARWAGRLRSTALRLVPSQWQARCFRAAGGRLAGAVESGVRFGGIDWRGTQAFSEELNYFPAIWLNVEGREPEGTVPAADYDRACAALTEGLLTWQDPIHRCRVVRKVWRRHELYRGPYVPMAPDLILDLATPEGYSYVCLPSLGSNGRPLERFATPRLSAGKLSGMSGSHRPDGLFVLAGDGIPAGEISGAHIADLAPTILALCGVSVPANWDGRLLPCIPPYGVPRPLGVGDSETGEQPYDATQEADLKRRLQELGYLT